MIEDNVKEALAKDMQVKTRLELDGRKANSSKSFYVQLAEKYNDLNWVPVSIVMPKVHSDFSESMVLPLQTKNITPEEAKQRFVSSRSSLHIMHNRWLASGSGKCMIDDEVSQADVYEFVDQDDCQEFFN